MSFSPSQIKEFLKSQVPETARRASLIFALQAVAYDELRRLSAPEAEGIRPALERLRREAEDLGAKPMGLATLQAAGPKLLEQLLGVLAGAPGASFD